MSQVITPFTVDIPQAELDQLSQRINTTRWPEAETVDESGNIVMGIVHDIKFKRVSKGGRVVVENVPPEEYPYDIPGYPKCEDDSVWKE